MDEELQTPAWLATRIVTMADVIDCREESDQATAASCLLAIGSALRTESRALQERTRPRVSGAPDHLARDAPLYHWSLCRAGRVQE